MTVAHPEEIGCRYCEARPGQRCVTRPQGGLPATRLVQTTPRGTPHAVRLADSGLVEAEPGWMPVEPTAQVLDFVEARMRKIAAANGVNL